MESTLQIMPVQRTSRNFGEFAEEAVIIEEPVKPKKVNHFIEANSVEVTLNHLKNENVIPVFSKDNELTISHPQFIETVWEAANSFYSGEQIEQPDIRCSHVIKGRKPEAINKPKNLLTEADTTQYYERCAFAIDIPSIYEDVSATGLIFLWLAFVPRIERTWQLRKVLNYSDWQFHSRIRFVVICAFSQTDIKTTLK